MSKTDRNAISEPNYFSSPAQAVSIARALLLAEDFSALASYYLLSGSGVDRATLESGEFFVRTVRPEVAHPAGFWRYKHPFAPSFELRDVQPTDKSNIYKVTMTVTIDQGSKEPQEGMSNFFMIQSERGWKILPDTH